MPKYFFRRKNGRRAHGWIVVNKFDIREQLIFLCHIKFFDQVEVIGTHVLLLIEYGFIHIGNSREQVG